MYHVLHIIKHYAQESVLSSRAYLLPLRFFLALGWLRASVEKLVSAHWSSGQSLEQFFLIAVHETPFGFYQALVQTGFLPNTEFLSFLVAALQGAIGLALLFGVLSQFALLLGIFLNLNFILAGVVNPSAFYIMIELVLLSGHAGAVLGVDAYLSRFIKQAWLVAQPHATKSKQLLDFQFWRNIVLIAVIAFFALLDFFYIKSFSPESSIEDPAMLLYILSIFTIIQLSICSIQIRQRLRLIDGPEQILRLSQAS